MLAVSKDDGNGRFALVCYESAEAAALAIIELNGTVTVGKKKYFLLI